MPDDETDGLSDLEKKYLEQLANPSQSYGPPPVQRGGRRAGRRPPGIMLDKGLEPMVEHFVFSHQGSTSIDSGHLADVLSKVRLNCIVVWTSNHKFTYVAVWANSRWFISGTGTFYGKNEFTHDEFCYQVLAHPEVSDIFISTEMIQLYRR